MTKTGKLFAWFLVICLHSSVLISCKPVLVPKKPSVPFKVLEPQSEDIKFIESNGVGLSCPKTYRGVGFRTNWGTMMITEIAPGSPASMSGLQVGDRVLEDIDLLHLPIGTSVTIPVERYDKKLSFEMKVTDICYERL